MHPPHSPLWHARRRAAMQHVPSPAAGPNDAGSIDAVSGSPTGPTPAAALPEPQRTAVPTEPQAGEECVTRGAGPPPPPAPPPPPPADMTLLTRALDAGCSLLQPLHPVKKVHQHVSAFHMYSHDATRPVRAHHFCSCLNEEMRQCLLWVGGWPAGGGAGCRVPRGGWRRSGGRVRPVGQRGGGADSTRGRCSAGKPCTGTATGWCVCWGGGAMLGAPASPIQHIASKTSASGAWQDA